MFYIYTLGFRQQPPTECGLEQGFYSDRDGLRGQFANQIMLQNVERGLLPS